MKADQCQPHENFWTARQSCQVVNWVKTKPKLAGNQILFGGTRFPAKLGLVVTQSTMIGMTGDLSKKFHGVGIGPLSKVNRLSLSLSVPFSDPKNSGGTEKRPPDPPF